MQKEIEGMREKLLQSRERFNTVQSEITRVEERRKQLQAGIGDVEATVARLESQEKEIKTNLVVLQQREKKLEAEIQDMRKRHMGGVSEEFEVIRTKDHEAENDLSETQERLKKYCKQNSRLTKNSIY